MNDLQAMTDRAITDRAITDRAITDRAMIERMTGTERPPRRMARMLFALAPALFLGGCLSGPKLPATLLTLTPEASVAAGSGGSGPLGAAIAVMEPGVPQKLDVKRVPVQVDAAQVAYLKDAVWVEKPARLFGGLLAETIRADGKWLVIDGTERKYSAQTRLDGQLLDMGYDAASSSAVVRFEAMLEGKDGQVATRRFEARVSGVSPKPRRVGTALNAAANDVARQVLAWIGPGPQPVP